MLRMLRSRCIHSGAARRSIAFAVAALGPILTPLSADAEQIIGLTVQNLLISFDSATPGTVSNIGAVTGVTAGDTLVGIDRRPQAVGGAPGPNNGRLYAAGVNLGTGTARVYTLDESSAAATLVSTLSADPADATAPFPFTTVAGTMFGVDFNPVPDRLRLISNTGQNLRINVDNGLVQFDVPLAYQSGDPNFGDSPAIFAVAYSNNSGGATTTVLRGVDAGQDPDALVVHTNPNGGLLQTSLGLVFNSAQEASYDVSGATGSPYFAIAAAGSGSSSFYIAGPSGVSLVGTIGGGVALRGIAAPVGDPIPEPSAVLLLGIGSCLVYMRSRAEAMA